jgi:predicted Fe-Mo cluster-binding NifX family protein
MERIGIPHYFGRVSPVLDVAGSLQIYHVEESRAQRGEERYLYNRDLYLRAKEVRACGLAAVICGAVSRPLEVALNLMGMRVIAFMRGQIDDVADAFAKGDLQSETFRMPGCRRRAGRPRCGLRRIAGDGRATKDGAMKVAVTSSDGTMEGAVDARCGRCRKFVESAADSKTGRVMDNAADPYLSQEAGLQTARTILKAGAQAVISGHIGPKAFRMLSSAGIAIYSASNMSVAEAITRYEEGSLTKLSAADVQGRW